MKELAKAYNPKEVEGKIYKAWKRAGILVLRRKKVSRHMSSLFHHQC